MTGIEVSKCWAKLVPPLLDLARGFELELRNGSFFLSGGAGLCPADSKCTASATSTTEGHCPGCMVSEQDLGNPNFDIFTNVRLFEETKTIIQTPNASASHRYMLVFKRSAFQFCIFLSICNSLVIDSLSLSLSLSLSVCVWVWVCSCVCARWHSFSGSKSVSRKESKLASTICSKLPSAFRCSFCWIRSTVWVPVCACS